MFEALSIFGIHMKLQVDGGIKNINYVNIPLVALVKILR
jgi:hypothetical protein